MKYLKTSNFDLAFLVLNHCQNQDALHNTILNLCCEAKKQTHSSITNIRKNPEITRGNGNFHHYKKYSEVK